MCLLLFSNLDLRDHHDIVRQTEDRQTEYFVLNAEATRTIPEIWPLRIIWNFTRIACVKWYGFFNSPEMYLVICSITRPNFSQPFSRFAVVYQSVCCRTITDRLQYDCIRGKNLVEHWNVFQIFNQTWTSLASIKCVYITDLSLISTHTPFALNWRRYLRWATRSDFFLRSIRIRVDLLSYDSKTTDKQEQCDRMVEKNWTGGAIPLSSFSIIRFAPSQWVMDRGKGQKAIAS